MSRLPEQRAWDTLKRNATGRLLLKRVETTTGDPLADVVGQNKQGCAFWLELKALPEWPKRATTLPLARIFEKGQIPFAKEWTCWGGHAYILVRVGLSEWFLLNPSGRIKELVEMTQADIRHASLSWTLADAISHLEEIK